MEDNALRIAAAPSGFLRRPEFQPRSPAGAGPPAWLPEDPFFAPPLEPEELSRRPPPALPPAVGDLFRAVAERWRLPLGQRALENLSLLSQPGIRLVIAGQQPGFLTGPLYTVYKAVAAAAAARRLESLTGARHIPVFWVAGEDHDLDEARAARFPGHGGPSVEFALPHAADRRPLSAYPVDRAAEEVLDAVRSHLSGRRHSAMARELVDLYRGRDLAGGFAAMIVCLLEREGLLVIEPETLRPRAAPLLQRALEQPVELLASIREGIRLVEAHGVPAQVPDRFPLFLLEDGKRHHLSLEEPAGRSDGVVRFRLDGRNQTYTRSELLSILMAHPERFSTGVLLRPVVQEAVLPSAVCLGGAAEIAYYAQLRPVFAWFGLPPPRIALRLSATLIEGKVARALRRLGLDRGEEDAVERWSRARGPADLLPALPDGPERSLEALAAEAEERLSAALGDPRIPEVPRRRLQLAARKITGEIRGLGARAGRAAHESQEQDLAAAVKVFGHFLPDGVLQERRWNVLYYVAKYGTEWIGELLQAVAADPFRVQHRWVFFSEGKLREDEE